MVDVTSHRLHTLPDNQAIPHLRLVDTERPWVWLAAGWRDMAANPLVSAFYGVLAVASSFGLVAGLAMAELHYLVLPLAAGFALLGPVLAVGLYEASRLAERGEAVTAGRVLGAYRRNATQIGGMGMALLVVFLGWIQVAFLLFMMFFSAAPPALDQLVSSIFFSSMTIPFLLTGTLVGAVFAAGAFAISVVALPMLLDRETDSFTAMATSIAAVRRNPRTMMVWAALIALFTAAGIATAFIGLAITFPLIGHASWHCYRDLVAER